MRKELIDRGRGMSYSTCMEFTRTSSTTASVSTKYGTFYAKVAPGGDINITTQEKHTVYEYVTINGVKITADLQIHDNGVGGNYSVIRREGGIMADEPTANMKAKVWEVAREINKGLRANTAWYENAVKQAKNKDTIWLIGSLEREIERKKAELEALRLTLL